MSIKFGTAVPLAATLRLTPAQLARLEAAGWVPGSGALEEWLVERAEAGAYTWVTWVAPTGDGGRARRCNTCGVTGPYGGPPLHASTCPIEMATKRNMAPDAGVPR